MCVQQDGANIDLIIVISISCGCGSITCGNPLNVVEESDNEDELYRSIRDERNQFSIVYR